MKPKKKQMKPIVFFMLGVLLSLVLTMGFMGFLMERNSHIARLEGKMDCWDAEEMCVQLHDMVLDGEGYCDITSDYEKSGGYVHFFDCSWAKLKIHGFTEHFTLMDKYDFWYVNCDYVKTEKG